MKVELKINFGKIFGVGELQGSTGTLQRYLSQTDAGDGRITIDGIEKTLSEAQTELSSHLSTDVTEIADLTATESNSDSSLGNWFYLEIIIS